MYTEYDQSPAILNLFYHILLTFLLRTLAESREQDSQVKF